MGPTAREATARIEAGEAALYKALQTGPKGGAGAGRGGGYRSASRSAAAPSAIACRTFPTSRA